MLVGYTGFVGSNLANSHLFDYLINSKNIESAYGTNPDLLVYAGVRAEKFLANTNPEADMDNIRIAMNNIKKINPKKLVLISTVDVYKTPVEVDEDSVIEDENLHAYGLNRYRLEQWVEEYSTDYIIIRLPGLYGENLKKNFIFDYINVLHSMLNESKFQDLTEDSKGESGAFIGKQYKKQSNGFYQCVVKEEDREALKNAFKTVGFSALNFTDSRAVFQFYQLNRLWKDIEKAMEAGIKKLNIATEPVSVGEIYEMLTGTSFTNEVASVIPHYDYRSKYAEVFGGDHGYLQGKEEVLEDIRKFVEKG